MTSLHSFRLQALPSNVWTTNVDKMLLSVCEVLISKLFFTLDSNILFTRIFAYNPQFHRAPPYMPTCLSRYMPILTGHSLSDIKVATAKNIACINCNVIISALLEPIDYYTR